MFGYWKQINKPYKRRKIHLYEEVSGFPVCGCHTHMGFAHKAQFIVVRYASPDVRDIEIDGLPECKKCRRLLRIWQADVLATPARMNRTESREG